MAQAPASPSVPQQARPKPRPKKIWTNEDIVALRKPVDLFLIEKEKQADQERKTREAEEAAKRAAPQGGQPATTGQPAVQLPNTADGIDKRIAEVQEQLDALQQQLDDFEQQMANASEEERGLGNQKRGELMKQKEKLENEMQLLREKLEKLRPQNPSIPSE